LKKTLQQGLENQQNRINMRASVFLTGTQKEFALPGPAHGIELECTIEDLRCSVPCGKKEGVVQNQSPESVAQPSRIQLRVFADTLSSLHPADLGHILRSIAEFGYQFYPVIDLSRGETVQFIDHLHEATDLAHTLAVVFKDVYHHPFSSCLPKCEVNVHLFMTDVHRVFYLAIGYFTSECNDDRRKDADLVMAQLQRLLAGSTSMPSSTPSQKINVTHTLASPLSILAAVCFAGLVWDLIADHVPLWQLLAALALVIAFGGLVFRLGQKAAASITGVSRELNR
jgi:hypothetical protein